MNANIIETQFFHKKKHDIDHKGQEGHIRPLLLKIFIAVINRF